MRQAFYKPIWSILCILVIQFSACDQPSFEQKSIDSHHLYIINQIGLDASDVRDMGEHYLIEGDIAIKKENIESYFSENDVEAQTRQGRYYTNFLVDPFKASDIKIYIYDGTEQWKQAVINACDAWNNIPSCIIKFNIVTNSNSADLYVSMDQSIQAPTIAFAYYPVDTDPGHGLHINPYYNYLSDGQKTFVIAHELGHIVGLGHTNFQANGDTHIIHIPGTPTTDNTSIMGSHVGGWDWNTSKFSAGDILAIQTLYPPMDYFTIPAYGFMEVFADVSKVSRRGGSGDVFGRYYTAEGNHSARIEYELSGHFQNNANNTFLSLVRVTKWDGNLYKISFHVKENNTGHYRVLRMGGSVLQYYQVPY